MQNSPAYIIKVLSGPNASDEVRLGVAPITIGSGQRDSIRVFDEGILTEHLRIFPIVEETDPDAEPEEWGFAYQAGASIKNSADNARFGSVSSGMTFDIGGTRLQVNPDRHAKGGSKIGSLREPSASAALAIIVLAVLVFAGLFSWNAFLQRTEKPKQAFYFAYAELFREGSPVVQSQVEACLKAPVTLTEYERDELDPNRANYPFLALRAASADDSNVDDIRENFIAELNRHFQRAVLLHETENFAGVRLELQSIVDLMPVQPDKCRIVLATLSDLSIREPRGR